MSKVYFGQEEADHIFEELMPLDMELDEDPLSFGPKRINNKFALVRGMLSRCERIFLDVSKQLHAMKRSLKIKTLELDLAKKHLFATDPETRAGKSVADREAIASGKLHQTTMEVHDLEMAVESLMAVWSIVKTKRADLKDIEGRLRDQHRLCQEEIGLGARWGSRAVGDVKLTPGIGNQSEISAMTEMLEGVDAEIHLGKADGTWKDPIEMDDLDEDSEEEEETEETSESVTDKIIDETESLVETPVEELLVPTATTEETDSFLKQEVVAPKKPAPKKKTKILEDEDLSSILDMFENE